MAINPSGQVFDRHSVRDVVHKEVQRFLVGRVHRIAVQLQEKLATDPRDPLVAIDEWLIFGKRLHERGSFQRYSRICVFSER